MKYLLYSIFVLFSLGQIGRLSFFNQQVNVYLYEGVAVIALLVLFSKYRFEPIHKYFKRLNLLYIFLIYLTFSFLLGVLGFKTWENLISFLYLIRLIFYFVFFFYLTYYLRKMSLAYTYILRSIYVFILITVFLSVGQYIFYPNLRNLLYAGWDPHLFRLFGVYLDTSTAGAIFGMIFFLLLLKGKEIIKNSLIRYVFIGFFLVFVTMSFSRGLYLSSILIIVLFGVMRKSYKSVIPILVIFFMLILLVPKPTGEGVNLLRLFTIESRLNDYKVAEKIWRTEPVFGIGYNRIRYEKLKLNIEEEVRLSESHSGASFHSSFLIILVTGGVIGLLLFLGVLVQFALLNREIFYLTSFLSIFSLSDNILLQPFVLFFYLISVVWMFNPSRTSL